MNPMTMTSMIDDLLLIIANVHALKNSDAQIDFQTDFVTEIARLGFWLKS